MYIQDFISSGPVTRLGLFLGRHLSRQAGYGLARRVANVIVRRKPTVYRTVRANLRQIVGPQLDSGALDEMVRQVFFHAGQTYYDFFHAVDQPLEVFIEAVRVPESLIERIEFEMVTGRGVLLLGTHMSNFDLVGLAVGAHDLPVQVLSLANPGAGFRVLNHLRATQGFEITPITHQSLRVAIRRLRSGGIVATGVDRPVPQDQALVEFFGRPAYLPVGPARMALRSGAAVIVGSCRYDSDEGYVLEFVGPLEMVRTGDRRQDILSNTRRWAAIVEGYVRAHPEQWMMFHPVWPNSSTAEIA
jgi:lauroyl/myristoyl acyltransferase